MKSNISKSLGAIVARATFSTMKHGVSSNLLDHLFVEIMNRESSLAFKTISKMLESWQIYKLRQSVEQEFSTEQSREATTERLRPELYYASMLKDMEERYPQGEKMTSLHALHTISLDDSTAASRLLNAYGLSAQIIETELMRHVVNSELLAYGGAQVYRLADSSPPQPAKVEETPPHPLDKFGVDMTRLAREGSIDPVVGREEEIERVVQILSRRKKNNPILLGEAGVGKSAIVEGLALRMVSGSVPHTISGRRLFSLELSSLVAGTKFRGEFEERMKQLLDALHQSDDSIVFIDEIHTIVGAGSSQGSLDVANILKPALSRGEFRCIGATTLDEYRRDIESDAALVRRFQRILVEPTTQEQTLTILNAIAPRYEEHHRVKYSSQALEACVSLSARYITASQLPDKAIDLLDETGSLVRTESATSREVSVGDVERVVSMISGVPVQSLSRSERSRVHSLSKHLHSVVVGQGEAVESIARTIMRSRVGIRDESRPIGTFLFVGPTGVGKTLLAKELAKWLFDRDSSLLRIDMSEYSLSHNLARLIGSPPGYVGYGQGGELTEPVRREPYSVILLDEIEKAHPDTFNLLLQLLDEGHLCDGVGRRVDFRNTIIIMTSNIGSRKIADTPPKIGYGVGESDTKPSSSREYRREMERCFPPEFLNRIDDIVIFNSLEESTIEQIVDLELTKTLSRVSALGYNIRITPSARRVIARRGYDRRYGARALRRTMVELIENPISSMIISGEVSQGGEIIIEKSRKNEALRMKVA